MMTFTNILKKMWFSQNDIDFFQAQTKGLAHVVKKHVVKKVERWKKLNSWQKYAYVFGELLGITFGIVFFAVLGWVNGRIAQNLYIGFIFGALVFGLAFGKRLSRRYASRA